MFGMIYMFVPSLDSWHSACRAARDDWRPVVEQHLKLFLCSRKKQKNYKVQWKRRWRWKWQTNSHKSYAGNLHMLEAVQHISGYSPGNWLVVVTEKKRFYSPPARTTRPHHQNTRLGRKKKSLLSAKHSGLCFEVVWYSDSMWWLCWQRLACASHCLQS